MVICILKFLGAFVGVTVGFVLLLFIVCLIANINPEYDPGFQLESEDPGDLVIWD